MLSLIEWYEKLARRRESEICGKSGNGPEGRNYYSDVGIYTPGGHVGKDGDVMIAGGLVCSIVEIFVPD